MKSRLARVATAALCAVLLLPLFMLPVGQGADTGGTVVWSEDFDSSWPGTLPDGWDYGDRDAGSGLDHWSRSSYETLSGTFAAWCAQTGDNSQYGNDANSNVSRYDTGMDAFLRRPVDLGNYTSATLTFSYWAHTGNSTTTLGRDYLWVSVTDSNDELPSSGDRTQVWKQPASNSSGWKSVTVAIPADTTWISFNFESGASTPSGGPFIGAFIDDITIEGAGSERLASKAGPLPEAINKRAFDVPVVFVAGKSDLDYVQLYYRVNGTGTFSLFTTPASPSGRWDDGPIPFLAPGDGRVELFTRAADNRGNLEAMKTAAEVTILVDTSPPSSVAALNGTWGTNEWYASPVEVDLTGWDGSSGVASILFRVDGGAWAEHDGPVTISWDGRHSFEHYAVDRAGNNETVRSVSVLIDTSGPQVRFSSPNGAVFASGDLVVRFDASDALSGIALADYSVDGGEFQSLSTGARRISLSGLADGEHRVVLRMWDRAGNPTEVSLDLKVDPTAAGGNVLSAAGPLVITALTLVGLVSIILMARRRGPGAGG